MKLIVIPIAVLVMFVLQVLMWAAERTPPFRSGPYTATPAKSPGFTRIDRQVQRDAGRKCSVSFSRYIYDSTGARTDLFAKPQHMSAEERRALQARTPDRILEVVQIPPGLAPGAAKLHTSLVYECNPLHVIWPIELTTVLDIEIVP